MEHPFEIGGEYRNRKGAYTVLAIEGDEMTVRYADGTQQTTQVALQARIWQAIQDEEAPPLRNLRPDEYDSLETQPVAELVQTVLKAKFAYPYPDDIIDQVCLAIEENPEWLRRYHNLVEHFSSRGKDGKLMVKTAMATAIRHISAMPRKNLSPGYNPD